MERDFSHPEYDQVFLLDEYLGVYSSHSNHQLAHIKKTLKYKGEFKDN